ncbi:unnamed protein product, partial [Iphiclides podalirius]
MSDIITYMTSGSRFAATAGRHASCSEHECGARSSASHTSTSGVGGRLTGGKRRGAGSWCARTPPPSSPTAPPLSHQPPAATPPAAWLITPRGAPLPFSSCSCELFATATLPSAPSIVYF